VALVGLGVSTDGRWVAALGKEYQRPAGPGRSADWLDGLSVLLWDAATAARRAELPAPKPGWEAFGTTFFPSGRFLTGEPRGGGCCVWDVSSEPATLVPLPTDRYDLLVQFHLTPAPDGLGVLTLDGATDAALRALPSGVVRTRYHLGRLHFDLSGIDTRGHFSPDGQLLVVNHHTDSWAGRLPDPVRRWLTETRLTAEDYCVVHAFDAAIGRSLRRIARPGHWSLQFVRFSADGRSFWTGSRNDTDPYAGLVRFERWSIEPGWPWGMIGVTVGVVAMIALSLASRERQRPE
jgi:hypothetical protein